MNFIREAVEQLKADDMLNDELIRSANYTGNFRKNINKRIHAAALDF